MRLRLRKKSILAGLSAAIWPATALGQNIGDTGTSAPTGGAATHGATGTPQDPGTAPPQPAAPGAPTVTTVYRPYGLPYPGTNPDSHLPSSSRSSTDTSRSADGFDLAGDEGAGGTVHGDPNGAGTLGGSRNRLLGRTRLTLRPGGVPDIHRVEK